MPEDIVDLDTPAGPTIPDWMTVGAEAVLVTGGNYARSRHAQRVTVKTIGKRDIIVSYTREGFDKPITERFRHTDYNASFADNNCYHRWNNASSMSGYSMDLMPVGHPLLEKIELQSDYEIAANRVRNAMSVWSSADAVTTSNLRRALITHENARTRLDAYNAAHPKNPLAV